jgi:hypothetical protein
VPAEKAFSCSIAPAAKAGAAFVPRKQASTSASKAMRRAGRNAMIMEFRLQREGALGRRIRKINPIAAEPA